MLGLQTQLLSGLGAGLAATLIMTVFMQTFGDDESPPPTAELWAKYVGEGEPTEYIKQGMALHLLYGTIAGGVFGLVLPLVYSVSVGVSIIGGLAYGFILTVLSAFFWVQTVLEKNPDDNMAMYQLFFHLVYGVSLGVIYGFLVIQL